MMFTVPKFSSKDDTNLWLYRYTKAASMNKWNENTMLQYVDNCFMQRLQLWFMDQDFNTWNQFKVAFLEKYSKKDNADKLISDIINVKMSPQESPIEYIERYDKLRLKYNNQINKLNKKTSVKTNDNTENKNESSSTNTETKEKENWESIEDNEVEFVITKTGFLRYFIKGLYSKSMIRFVKIEKPSTLEEAYQIIKDVYGTDDESSEVSSIECSESESKSDYDTKNKAVNPTLWKNFY